MAISVFFQQFCPKGLWCTSVIDNIYGSLLQKPGSFLPFEGCLTWLVDLSFCLLTLLSLSRSRSLSDNSSSWDNYPSGELLFTHTGAISAPVCTNNAIMNVFNLFPHITLFSLTPHLRVLRRSWLVQRHGGPRHHHPGDHPERRKYATSESPVYPNATARSFLTSC